MDVVLHPSSRQRWVWWRGRWWTWSEDGQSFGLYGWRLVHRPFHLPDPYLPDRYIRHYYFTWEWGFISYQELVEHRERTLQRYRDAVLAGERNPVSDASSDMDL